MPTAGFRPQGSSGPPYEPQRDIAYIGPTLIKTALDFLFVDKLQQNPEMAAYLDRHNISQEQLNDAVVAIAEAQKDFVSVVEADKVKTPHEALTKVHFFDYPLPVRLLVFACVGECLFGAYFQAVRDVTYMNEDSPASKEIAHLLYAARTMSGKEPVDETIKVDEYGARIIEMQQQLQNRDAKIETLEHDLRTAKKNLATLNQFNDDLSRGVHARQRELEQLKGRSLWQVIKDSLRRSPPPAATPQ